MQHLDFGFLRERQLRRLGAGLLIALAVALGACTTTKRAAQLVVDHHVGMARGALDIVSGKAEEREQRVAKLRADLDASGSALAAEQEQARLVELLKQHVALQDALVAELLQAHGHHHDGGHQHTQAETTQAESQSHQH